MDTYRDNLCEKLADRIYTECFGHLDDKQFRTRKHQEIWEWLEDGDYATEELETIKPEELIAEWREYDADDPNIR